MRTPASLVTLVEYGLVDEVIRPLMSGKEAQIYLVLSQGEERVAKVYREAEHRNFKHRVEYTEGRKTRNTRDQRAMGKRSSYGRAQDEAAWRAAEVDMIYRLSDAGVPVPKPYHFVDGVLIMELVKGEDGRPAPRLGDLNLGPDEASAIYEILIREVVRMLAAGVVHGDLSDFNVLLGTQGPVIIDFPQSVDASSNTGARRLLIRDVDNLHNFAKRFLVGAQPRPYAQEMWELYQRGELTPDTVLRGQFKAATAKVDTDDVLGLIREAEADERFRRQQQGGAAGPSPRRREVVIAKPEPAPARARQEKRQPERSGPAPRGNGRDGRRGPVPVQQGGAAARPDAGGAGGLGNAPQRSSETSKAVRERRDGGDVRPQQQPLRHGTQPDSRNASREAGRHQDAPAAVRRGPHGEPAPRPSQGGGPIEPTEGQRRRRRRKPRPPQSAEGQGVAGDAVQGRGPSQPSAYQHRAPDRQQGPGPGGEQRGTAGPAGRPAANAHEATDRDPAAPRRRRRRRGPRKPRDQDPSPP